LGVYGCENATECATTFLRRFVRGWPRIEIAILASVAYPTDSNHFLSLVFRTLGGEHGDEGRREIEGPGWVVFSALPEKAAVSNRCPCCQSNQIYRSRTKGILESVMSRIFVRPYRCVDCDCRFFRWSLRAKSASVRVVRTS